MYNIALEHIESNEYKKAVSIAKKLIKINFTGGYEIMARSFAANDKLQKAVDTLKFAIEKDANTFPLWFLLGQYYADLNMFHEAHEAFRNAHDCEISDPDSINFEIARTLLLEDKYDEAMKLSGQLLSTNDICLQLQVYALIFCADIKYHRYEQVLKHERTVIDISNAKESESISNSLKSSLHSYLATAYWNGQNDKAHAKTHIQDALWLDPRNQSALSLLREINNQSANNSNLYIVNVNGILSTDSAFLLSTGVKGFYTTIHVVADEKQECFQFIKEIFPNNFCTQIIIDRVNVKKNNCNALKGVVFYSGFTYYMCDG